MLQKGGFGIYLCVSDGKNKEKSAGREWESITGISVPEGELLFIASPCCALVMSSSPTGSMQHFVLPS